MLKISLIDSVRQRRLVVEGKLVAPWAAELRDARQEASADLDGRELIIEMQYITTISQEGENVILGLIKWRNSIPMLRCVYEACCQSADGPRKQGLWDTSRRLTFLVRKKR